MMKDHHSQARRTTKTAIMALVLACGLSAAAEASPKNGAPIVYKHGATAPAAQPVHMAQAPALSHADKASARIDFRYPETSAPVRTAAASTAPVAASRQEAARIEAPQLVTPPARTEIETAALPPVATQAGQGGAVPLTPISEPAQTAESEFVETGLALVYGEEFAGLPTANGEVFSQTEMTAAHPSLPLPSLVHVTNMETGREVVVRVNDRGPFEEGANLQLSRQAATALGFTGSGKGNVRLKYLGPAPVLSAAGMPQPTQASQPQAMPPKPVKVASIAPQASVRKDVVWPVAAEDHELMGASSAPTRTHQLMSLTVDTPELVRPVPAVSSADAHYVQLAAFSELGNAEAMLRRVEGVMPVEIVPARVNGADFFRVRVGPFENRSSAEQVRERLQAQGTADGRVVRGS